MANVQDPQGSVGPRRRVIRLGAVSYLNTGPLVYGLDEQPDLFRIRFDVPSRCAALLHDNQVDLGLIPSIEYLHDPEYRIVPGVAIASDGEVASVALFGRRPIREVRSIALDTGSRTSVALLRILCARRFKIAPKFIPMQPDLNGMLNACDAALVIGDNALFVEESSGLEKIDLGEEWKAMTGLPFVYAFWAGRPDVATPDHVVALNRAPDYGLPVAESIAERYFPEVPAKISRGAKYLRENVKYALDEGAKAGLRMFYSLAAELGIVPAARDLRFYPDSTK